MVEEENDFKKNLRNITFKALKATLKGLILYVLYYVGLKFLAPFGALPLGLQQTVDAFATVYIFLVIIGAFTSGTVFEHFFNVSKALFVISFLALSLKGGIMGMTIQNINLTIDLSFFIIFAMLLGLLGLAKSVLQTISYLSQKAEHATIKSPI